MNPILFGKKILSIFSNCDERKMIILNLKTKKKKNKHARNVCDEANINIINLYKEKKKLFGSLKDKFLTPPLLICLLTILE